MGDIIDLHSKPRFGEQSFVMCDCTDDGTPMLPVVKHGAVTFIAMLVCPECEVEVPVVNGIVEEGP